MKTLALLLFVASLLAGLTSCSSFDTVSLSVGYGKANVAGTVHLREPTPK